MNKNDILTYEDITKIKLTGNKGFTLNDTELPDYTRLEEFEFIDQFGEKQIADVLFYMMGEGYVITAKNTNMTRFICLGDFLDNLNIEYKDAERLKKEEKWRQEKLEEQKRIEHRNKLEHYKRPKEKLGIGETRTTLLEQGEYKQLKYEIYLYEHDEGRDEYFLEIETPTNRYTEPFYYIEDLKKAQHKLLEKYSNLKEASAIFDIYIGYCENIVIVKDMTDYQAILKYNNKKFNTTNNIKNDLLKLKFKWISDRKRWEFNANTEEKARELVSSLRAKLISEYARKELSGMQYCGECGCAFLNKHYCV